MAFSTGWSNDGMRLLATFAEADTNKDGAIGQNELLMFHTNNPHTK